MLIGNLETKNGSRLDKDVELYGFRIDQNESDPSSMISYIEDNRYYEPAFMDFTSGKFNYGDWRDAFFMKIQPCMVNYSGNVDYFLDPNNYSKKLNGGSSDISNTSYSGNAMIQIPKIYYKVVENGKYIMVYFCNKKLDDDFHCYSHINNQGKEIDFCYMSIYQCCLINNTLRSLSGQSPMNNKSMQDIIELSMKNNKTNDILWYIHTFSDWALINLLLILISKTTDSKSAFGQGNHSSYVDASNAGVIKSGSMDDKGLFYGVADEGYSGVKVFGIENFWGNLYKMIAGLIYLPNIGMRIKSTWTQYDGSTVDGYNLDATGYIDIPNSKYSELSGYTSRVKGSKYGLIPIENLGSDSTYFCCSSVYDKKQNSPGIAAVGGRSFNGKNVGGLYVSLTCTDATMPATTTGTCLSLKPLH